MDTGPGYVVEHWDRPDFKRRDESVPARDIATSGKEVG